jgi:DNA polymerase III subunit alpha
MYIALHVHSQYSILDSCASIEALAQAAKDQNMKALALTDSGNMFGSVDFFKACKAQSIKPIIGCELWLSHASRLEKKKVPGIPNAYPLVLLAKNQIGYKNLCKLTSAGYVDGFYYKPRIDKQLLKKHSEGLICFSGSINAKIPYLFLNEDKELEEEVLWHKDVFGEDFYFELQRHSMSDENLQNDGMYKESWLIQKYEDYIARQSKLNIGVLELSKKYDIPCVATNDVHYINKEDWKGHEILLNVQGGEPCEIWERDSQGNPKQRVPNPKRKVYPTHEFYFRSSQQMIDIFSDIPEAIQTTEQIANKCDFEFDFTKKNYPVFEVPKEEKKNEKETDDYLYKLCCDALPRRYDEKVLEKVKEKHPDKDPSDVVKKRLEYEFKIISSKGMCDYLLIVYDFISWAKKNGIAVGPGRGSAAGSILSYLLGITDIEPLSFNLFFERFINPERISYPDIDVDICMERRSEVINYTINKYGKDKVAQIITFGKMKAKMAIRDVGRVLNVALSKVNSIAKLVPEDVNMTLEKALQIDQDLLSFYNTDEEAKMVIDIAKKIEGSIRNTSIHAAGIIISANPLTDDIPVCISKDTDMLVTQYSMKPVEAVGMLKIDFLGLKTLTSIQTAALLVEKNHEKKINWEKLGLEDEATFSLLNQGKTLGVFQLESGGMQDLARQLHIDKFEEIIAVAALYRPGPMDMIPSFINRKHKREVIQLDHPWMEEILKETYGVMVYQEQVMQIASKLAGYSLGEGDVLRRAMGKKDKNEMDRQSKKFVTGAVDKGIDKDTAVLIFEKIEKFASYGFNKSHAAAYSYLSFVTAYFKANFPHEWMAALMTCDKDDLTKVAKFIRECQSMQIEILSPDVNEADVEFVPTKSGIRFAMSGIKGVGSAVVEYIIQERGVNGPYKSLFDFIKRIEHSKVGRKATSLLIEAGCFYFTKWTRDELFESVDEMYDHSFREKEDEKKGVMNFFSLLDNEKEHFASPPTKIKNVSTKLEILQKEKELLGFYLTAHPMEIYYPIMKKLGCIALKDLENMSGDSVCRCAFILETVNIKISSKTQKKFAILTISDGMEKYELPIWPDLYEKKSELIKENQLLFAVLQVDKKDGSFRLQCRWFDELAKVDEDMIKACDLACEVAKHKFKSYNKRKSFNKDEKKEAKKPDILSLKIDVNLASLSQILNLKDILRSNPGKSPIDMYFFNKNKKLGVVSINATWGVELSKTIKDKIEKLQSVVALHVKKQ